MIVVSHGWWRLAVVGVLFTVACALVVWRGGLMRPQPVVRAAMRATVQLVAVTAVVGVVLASVPLSFGFLLLMAGVAVCTCVARTGIGVRGSWVGLAVLAGTVPAIGVLLLTGAVPLSGVALVPIGGILIGGAMTATTLAVRRVLDTLQQRHGEYEAALSLGFEESDAVRELVRRPAADALLPVLDQTRTVGLVTLPGAFVGMVLGGASAWQAGAVQLLVLLGLLAVEAVAIVVVVELVAHGRVRRSSHVGEVGLI